MRYKMFNGEGPSFLNIIYSMVQEKPARFKVQHMPQPLLKDFNKHIPGRDLAKDSFG
jgi:hypothetical protein